VIVSGYAKPGSLMAIIGPSGSEKSTLLDTLASKFCFEFFKQCWRMCMFSKALERRKCQC